MKDFEILSRATAFLLSVDPPDKRDDDGTTRSAREELVARSVEEREARKKRREYLHSPAGGPPRPAHELSWLEFCPVTFRPSVHCVAASHVLAPWKWNNYYPQDWLRKVKQEHCAYSLEVFDSGADRRNENALAKFALNPFPIHHPNGMDLAIIHLKQEDTALAHMKDLGVEILHLREDGKDFRGGDQVVFDGFEITEESTVDQEKPEASKSSKEEEDTRVFMPYNVTGELIFASPTRFLASTKDPLPEGLCGGPTLDSDGRVCGIVEGIVPVDHQDKRIAGAASFLPSPVVTEFLNYAERLMLEQIVPKDVFDKVVDLKDKKPLSASQSEVNLGDNKGSEESDGPSLEAMYDDLVENMKKSHTMDEVNAVLATVQREREEVLEILEKEGGDLDEIVARVREKTRRVQREIMESMAEKSEQEAPEDAEYQDKKGT